MPLIVLGRTEIRHYAVFAPRRVVGVFIMSSVLRIFPETLDIVREIGYTIGIVKRKMVAALVVVWSHLTYSWVTLPNSGCQR